MKSLIWRKIKLIAIFILAAVLLCPIGEVQERPPAAMATVTPSPEPTAEPQTEMVWVPITGARYHNNPRCSGMKNPEYVSIQDAVDRGYTPCKNCY